MIPNREACLNTHTDKLTTVDQANAQVTSCTDAPTIDPSKTTIEP